VLFALTRDPSNIWWDRRDTPEHETRDAILASSLRDALKRLEHDRGKAEQGKWRWSRIRVENIWHPLRIEALSALNLSVQGGRESLNPSSGTGTHGSSWRLVVDLGPTLRAWGTYPGGQSANPFSPHYRDHIETWRRGELDSLRIPLRPELLGVAHLAAKLTLVNGKH
jgi:penicillin amidase